MIKFYVTDNNGRPHIFYDVARIDEHNIDEVYQFIKEMKLCINSQFY